MIDDIEAMNDRQRHALADSIELSAAMTRTADYHAPDLIVTVSTGRRCDEPECTGKHHAKGKCMVHYGEMMRADRPVATITPIRRKTA